MRKSSAHSQVIQLVNIMRLEDKARSCTNREEARLVIRQGYQS